MSGLLRRIKRSRAADVGEPPVEGVPVASDAAPTPATPVVAADRAVPAGLDPVEAPLRAPAGRRGRLRRRLRYLRRARELMLRDLGGLLYEVHRTGGGQIEPHATVIGAKVQRLTAVDAEAHAIESALGAARTETLVFQPGVGGTCAVCGELFGSDARFCSHCGASVPSAPAARVAAEQPAAPEQPSRRKWPWGHKRAGGPGEDAGGEAATAEGAPDAREAPTEVIAPGGSGEAREEQGPRDAAPAAPREAAPDSPPGDAAPAEGHPANGRDASDLSSGDPLVSRERS
jgi:hypothetical protein